MNYTTTLRDSFDDFEEMGRLRSRLKSYKADVDRKRTQSVKMTFNDGAAEEAKFVPSVRFRVAVYMPISDKLHAELKKRLQASMPNCRISLDFFTMFCILMPNS